MKSIIFFLSWFWIIPSGQAGDLKGKVKESADGIVVAVRGIEGKFQPHKKHAVITQKNMEFFPKILPVLVGTTVDFPNDELVIYHNVFSVSPGNQFDLGTYRIGETRSVTFKNTGIAEILCSIHTRMFAAAIVLDNPYFAIVNADGSYEIKNIPQGEYPVEIILVKKQKVIRRQAKIVIPEQGFVELNFGGTNGTKI